MNFFEWAAQHNGIPVLLILVTCVVFVMSYSHKHVKIAPNLIEFRVYLFGNKYYYGVACDTFCDRYNIYGMSCNVLQSAWS